MPEQQCCCLAQWAPTRSYFGDQTNLIFWKMTEIFLRLHLYFTKKSHPNQHIRIERVERNEDWETAHQFWDHAESEGSRYEGQGKTTILGLIVEWPGTYSMRSPWSACLTRLSLTRADILSSSPFRSSFMEEDTEPKPRDLKWNGTTTGFMLNAARFHTSSQSDFCQTLSYIHSPTCSPVCGPQFGREIGMRQSRWRECWMCPRRPEKVRNY